MSLNKRFIPNIVGQDMRVCCSNVFQTYNRESVREREERERGTGKGERERGERQREGAHLGISSNLQPDVDDTQLNEG